MSIRRDKRKSLINIQAATPKGDLILPTESFGINDDEFERQERESVRKKNAQNEVQSTLMGPPKQPSGVAKLAKMTAAERNDHIEKCVQLSAENKISTKNAFSLLLIDQMMDQIKKENSNFQVASTQLDASAKIYACRVDKVHTEAMRIAGGLIQPDKKSSKKKVSEDSDDEDGIKENNIDNIGDNEDMETARSKSKKKRNRKDIIAKEHTVLNAVWNLNSQNNSEGFLHELITSPEASEPGNCYFMANFEVTDSSCELMVLSELPSYRLDCAEDLSATCNLEDLPLPKLSMPNVSDLPMCPELNGLLSELTKPSSPDQEEDDDDDGMDFQDDGDIIEDDELQCDNLLNPVYNGTNLNNEFEMDADNETMGTVKQVGCRPYREPNAVVDFYNSISSQLLGPLQYSLVHRKSLNLMGGPEHWKVGHFSTSRPSDHSKKVVTRKRTKDPVNMEYEVDDNFFLPIVARHSITLTKRTIQLWSSQKLPNIIAVEDEYNMSRFEKVWMRDKATVYIVTGMKEDSTNSPACETMDYDDGHHGDGDNSFANDSNGDAPDHHENLGMSNSFLMEDDQDQMAGNKEGDAIPYAMRAKKIDMKLLKVTIWKLIKIGDTDSNKENVASNGTLPMSFSQLYRDLPAKLSSKMADALTPHLAFMALLHLANEENLCLKDQPDLLDVTILHE